MRSSIPVCVLCKQTDQSSSHAPPTSTVQPCQPVTPQAQKPYTPQPARRSAGETVSPSPPNCQTEQYELELLFVPSTHEARQTDVMLGGTDTMLGGTDAMLGGTDAMLGRTDTRLGGTDVMLGGTDVMLGGTDAMLGGTDTRLDGTDVMLGGTDTMPGGQN